MYSTFYNLYNNVIKEDNNKQILSSKIFFPNNEEVLKNLKYLQIKHNKTPKDNTNKEKKQQKEKTTNYTPKQQTNFVDGSLTEETEFDGL